MAVSCKVQLRAPNARPVLKLFSLNLMASQIAVLTNLDRNPINRYSTLTRALTAAF